MLAGWFDLAAYRRVRADLAEQLGLDPGAELRHFEVVILRDEDPTPRPRVGTITVPRPAQLPTAVPGFVGRADELAALATVEGVAVIVGAAGIGKTGLAAFGPRHTAHRCPDGQLYVNLRGWGPGNPLRPE